MIEELNEDDEGPWKERPHDDLSVKKFGAVLSSSVSPGIVFLAPVAQEYDLRKLDARPCGMYSARYGTHYLSAITIGCRIGDSQTVDTSKAQASYNAEAEMKAKYPSSALRFCEKSEGEKACGK